MRVQAQTIDQVQECVRSEKWIVPKGGGTKTALSSTTDGVASLDLSQLSGIIEYVPDEYTFTAFAGTTIADLTGALAEHSQYMPFDPLLAGRGATLGGTVAANSAGSGRYRYGGVRDFILGIQFVDGRGQLVRSGGKVVKNAAGFDLSKFMVGSLGRYGVLVSISIKVFPQPPAFVTLLVNYPDLHACLESSYRLASSPFEIDALDIVPKSDNVQLAIRLGGLSEILVERVKRIRQFLEAERSEAFEVLEDVLDGAYWRYVNDFAWAEHGQQVIKIPLQPRQIPPLDELFGQAPRRYTVGANIAWLALEDTESLERFLSDQGLVGLRLFGEPGHPYLGNRRGLSLARRVKQALDPDGRFLEA